MPDTTSEVPAGHGCRQCYRTGSPAVEMTLRGEVLAEIEGLPLADLSDYDETPEEMEEWLRTEVRGYDEILIAHDCNK